MCPPLLTPWRPHTMAAEVSVTTQLERMLQDGRGSQQLPAPGCVCECSAGSLHRATGHVSAPTTTCQTRRSCCWTSDG